MDTAIIREYKRQRSLGYFPTSATRALQSARTIVAWSAAGGYETSEGDTFQDDGDTVRLITKPDDDWESATDCGCEDEGCIPRNQERASRDGVFGIIGEWFDGEKWQEADAVWGFIGDDWRDSGHDVDIMQTTLEAFMHGTARVTA